MENSSDESEIAANLVDELLDAQQHDQNNDSDSDADGDELADIADGLLGATEMEDNSQQHGANAAIDVSTVLERAQQDPYRAYGDPVAVLSLGSTIQMQLVRKMFWALQQQQQRVRARAFDDGHATTSDIHQTVLDAFVCNSSIKSLATIAEQSGYGSKAIKLGLESNAAAMLYGGCWLLGACLLKWRSMFKSGKFKPLLVISKMRYDETPLRLRVTEVDNFFSQPNLHEKLATPKLKTGEASDYRFAKIFRVEWTIGALVKLIVVLYIYYIYIIYKYL